MKKFPHYHQPDAMDCGPTCLRMVAKLYGKNYSIQSLNENYSFTNSNKPAFSIEILNLDIL